MENDGLKIIHFNTQGFQSKVQNINKFVKIHNPDILVITEHFQKSKNQLEKIDGYKIVNSFCRKHNERGGVAIWAKNTISCEPRKDLDKHRREREFELVSVSVGDVVITGAYRPPDTSITEFHNHLTRYINKINQENVKHVLTGDFNIDNRRDNSTRDILKKHNLTFNITAQTHKAGGSLDNFITNFKKSKSRVIKSKISQFSDHSPIELVVEAEVDMIEKRESFFWRIFSKIFFWRERSGSNKEAPLEKNSSFFEGCKMFFSNIYHNFFDTTFDNASDVNSAVKEKKSKQNPNRTPNMNESNSLFSLLSGMFTSQSYSPSEKPPESIKNDRKMDLKKSDSILTRFFNFFKLLLV